ncbi:DUF1236 domain-containing protein [Mesorhizobium sp. M1E.F.Ca.ET.045.02.1.1]|uniref:DUF1236 domain-containing protein n=1 Tax=unclassified Mesorhizobium TaxID=325217 RepID=UPI000F761B7F|nr:MULTISPECIES: DUF1236 domain-containing protein [unclassified Mesorhizobium]AZO24550.1 DUF1236 domain-containing protein [Mesorhizobium sp. M1E.F.Ca.ET.045.02.1.1]RUW33696.1 DUF1236 domain-containing protein [Mesorhizobium sp. M1E.F.Ca.ET.041.01.1.1]RUW74574.1 DUF1236 domain-containing protein [Mesorhizobium sp. M1E.F.Ca.ET.063.01.1.1]RWD80639.1 MAG: DUF1236 domain-containing protein [Mesorhizobium sp.]
MKRLLITSMIALGVGCGAAMAQTESAQPSSDNNCVAGQADCQKGGKAQGKMKPRAEQKAQGQNGANTEEQVQGKAKMKTDEQAQGQAGTSTEQQAQGKTKMKTDEQAQGQAGTKTEEQAQGTAKCQTGMANCPKGSKTNEQAQGKTKTKTTEQNAQTKTGTTTEQNAQGNANVQTDQNKTASITNVTVEQKTQITQIIHETNIQPVRDVSFDISVGIEVPRHKIRLHRLPARIVKIVPAYEDYEYFVLADGRIVIVDPNTYTIVLILT